MAIDLKLIDKLLADYIEARRHHRRKLFKLKQLTKDVAGTCDAG